ncbi:cytochrome P450 [Aspergillus mulundensis]|uniref:Cytochrome P450 n=1 Tax=Aspergillus mulundensis TaxID=1810919 RepID=A0A3D8QS66_9EURO|nr:hypothetical protein DSM5745_09929 [Aspergillus mulundensis]RDW64518.1 hypothetical protein DSM5745_09929 [Aspergillus mulundensis]
MATIYSARANMRKADTYSVMSASSHVPSTINYINKQQHASKRKVLARLFTKTALRDVKDQILRHVNTFCAGLAGENYQPAWGAPKNIAAWSDYLTLNIINNLCYGKAFGLLREETHRYIPNIISCCFFQPKIAKYKLNHIFLSTISSQIQQFGGWIKQQADARKAAFAGTTSSTSPARDFFAHLSSPQPGNATQSAPTRKEIWVELLQLVIAGADTTAVAISGVFFHLLHTPSALSQTTAEILHTFDSYSDIRPGAKLRSCKFLHACINEALRLSPPVTGLAPRTVLRGGIEVDGVHFPEGTIVGSPIYALHRNSAYFAQPDSFVPGRWLSGEGGEDTYSAAGGRVPFCPFSVGPRSCVARRLAMDEISVAIARTLFLYELRLDGEWEGKEEYQLKGWMTSSREGPFVQFRSR